MSTTEEDGGGCPKRQEGAAEAAAGGGGVADQLDPDLGEEEVGEDAKGERASAGGASSSVASSTSSTAAAAPSSRAHLPTGEASAPSDKAVVPAPSTAVAKRRPPKPKRKRMDGLPDRPLSAYNFFFREERTRYLQEPTVELKPGESRFCVMGKEIASRWKKLPSRKAQKFRDLAAKDLERYRREMDEYHSAAARVKRLFGGGGGTGGAPPSGSAADSITSDPPERGAAPSTERRAAAAAEAALANLATFRVQSGSASDGGVRQALAEALAGRGGGGMGIPDGLLLGASAAATSPSTRRWDDGDDPSSAFATAARLLPLQLQPADALQVQQQLAQHRQEQLSLFEQVQRGLAAANNKSGLSLPHPDLVALLRMRGMTGPALPSSVTSSSSAAAQQQHFASLGSPSLAGSSDGAVDFLQAHGLRLGGLGLDPSGFLSGSPYVPTSAASALPLGLMGAGLLGGAPLGGGSEAGAALPSAQIEHFERYRHLQQQQQRERLALLAWNPTPFASPPSSALDYLFHSSSPAASRGRYDEDFLEAAAARRNAGTAPVPGNSGSRGGGDNIAQQQQQEALLLQLLRDELGRCSGGEGFGGGGGRP